VYLFGFILMCPQVRQTAGLAPAQLELLQASAYIRTLDLDLVSRLLQCLCLQLYLNYRLKSVAHLPWRQMSYK
jgi:hypothetical protein